MALSRSRLFTIRACFMLSAMLRKLAIVVLTCVASCASAQGFHWDVRKSHELTRKNAVRFSKELSPADRSVLIRAITAKLRPEMDDLDIHSEKQLRSAAANTRIELVDLDGDGTPEVLAQSWGMETCGAVGNCLFWIFKKTDGIYKPILSDGAQVFAVEDTSTNGFRDVTLAVHDSASESHLFPYGFSNGRYRRLGCYEAEWFPKPDGPMLKTPIIKRCSK
jgi:hypothetical protein